MSIGIDPALRQVYDIGIDPLETILDVCHTLILDLKILTQISLLFSKTFKSTVFSTVLQLHTLLFHSSKFLHKIVQKGILVISYKGTNFQSLQFVPESFQFVCMDH